MSNKQTVINPLFNPFIPQKYVSPVSKCVSEKTPDDEYIISRELKDVVVKTGDGEDDFVIEKKVVETSRIKRQEYIDSFAEDVGILNIMKKVQLTGDVSLFNQRERSSVALDEDGKEKIVDITGISDPEAVRVQLQQADSIFAGLPEDLKSVLANMTDDELKAWINSKAADAAEENNNKDGE